jgi:four helix bundle protein
MESRELRIDIQERSFQFAVRVVKLCQFLSDKAGVSRTLSNQLIRSGTSIGANIEEAQGGQSRADFLAKMSIALKESRETLYWLWLLSAADVVKLELIAELQSEANEITAILTSIVKSTQENNNKLRVES